MNDGLRETQKKYIAGCQHFRPQDAMFATKIGGSEVPRPKSPKGKCETVRAHIFTAVIYATNPFSSDMSPLVPLTPACIIKNDRPRYTVTKSDPCLA